MRPGPPEKLSKKSGITKADQECLSEARVLLGKDNEDAKVRFRKSCFHQECWRTETDQSGMFDLDELSEDEYHRAFINDGGVYLYISKQRGTPSATSMSAEW